MDMCADMFTGTYVGVLADMHMGMRMDMHMDMCTDARAHGRTDERTDGCTHPLLSSWATRWLALSYVAERKRREEAAEHSTARHVQYAQLVQCGRPCNVAARAIWPPEQRAVESGGKQGNKEKRDGKGQRRHAQTEA